MDSDLVHLLTRLLSGGHRDRRADELRADEPAGHRLRHEPRGRDGRGVRLLQLLLLGRRPPRRPDPPRPLDDLELVLHGGGRGRRRVRRDRHEEVVPRPDRLGRLLDRSMCLTLAYPFLHCMQTLEIFVIRRGKMISQLGAIHIGRSHIFLISPPPPLSEI